MNTEILNAKIISTKLGQDHGCLTADLTIEGDGWGCGFGGYCLDHWCADIGKHSSTDGYGAIIELMKTLEVESWEDIKGNFKVLVYPKTGFCSVDSISEQDIDNKFK